MKFNFPHIRNDHLETHQKIWRKHRRLALHSKPEESSPVMHPEIALCSEQAAGDRNPSVPQLHHSRHTLLLGQYHSLSHILPQPLWHLCEGRTTARFHNIGYISVTRQFISPNEPVQGSTEPPQCAPAASTSASGVLCIPHLQYTREWTVHLWIQTKHWSKLQKNLQALRALKALFVSDKIGLNVH